MSKVTHSTLKKILKGLFEEMTPFNPNIFNFEVWNPGGYVVIQIGSNEKAKGLKRDFFEEITVMTCKVGDLDKELWEDMIETFVVNVKNNLIKQINSGE
uniref:Uncharacterized protein n=1 Tax=Rhizobium phage IG49 TaxID=3129228 RepID=A0AAU8HYV1_9CAUD